MEGTSGSSQACLEEAGDMNDKPSPIAGSAPEERQSRFRQRRATGKAFVVERVGRASKGREESAPVVPPEQQQSSDRLGGDTYVVVPQELAEHGNENVARIARERQSRGEVPAGDIITVKRVR